MHDAPAAPLLVVNAGSSSLRLALYEQDPALAPRRIAAAHGDWSRPAAEQVRAFLDTQSLSAPRAVAHRVVHGGQQTAPALIDAAIETEIERFAPLAPLHNPLALQAIHACRALFGETLPQVAVFDTAFYGRLPELATRYALPRVLTERHGIRRYGFHGIAHEYLWTRWRELGGARGGRVVSLQLGAGCSVTATRDGAPLDTSMGFSPLEGLMMATRAGDVDPGALLHLQKTARLDAAALEKLLYNECGLLGVSGLSSDMRTLLASRDPSAQFAVELFCYRARKYLGAYATVLGGVDAILFGGGIGEHAPAVRARIVEDLQWLGVILDHSANDSAVGREAPLHAADGRVQLWVIPVDEAAMIARAAFALVPRSAH